MPSPDLNALAVQKVAQHPGASERVRKVRDIDAFHQPLVGLAGGPRQEVHVASADANQLSLPGDRQAVGAVDHRFALSMPALVSAPDKKSFSNANWPIFTCKSLKSTVGSADDPDPNKLAALKPLVLPVDYLVHRH